MATIPSRAFLILLLLCSCSKEDPSPYNYTSLAKTLAVLPPYKSITDRSVRFEVMFSESCLYESTVDKANTLIYIGDLNPLHSGVGVSWQPIGDKIVLYRNLRSPIESSTIAIDTINTGERAVIEVFVEDFRAEWYINDTMISRKPIGFDNELMWVSGPWMACKDHPRLEFMLNFL